MFSFAGTAQEAGAGGRSGAAALGWEDFSRERKHHVTKASR